MEFHDYISPYFYFEDCKDEELTITSCSASTEIVGKYGCDKAFDGVEEDGWATTRQGAGAWIKINLDGFHRLTKMMVLQRRGTKEKFKDISLELSINTVLNSTLRNEMVWETIAFEDVNTVTNYVNISALSVYNQFNNGFAELKVFGCASGTIMYFTCRK